MHKKLILITILTSLQNFTYNNPLEVEIPNLKDIFANVSEENITRIILVSGLVYTGSRTAYSAINYCIKENQNDKPNKNYYLPGGIAVGALAIILLSPKISAWFVKK